MEPFARLERGPPLGSEDHHEVPILHPEYHTFKVYHDGRGTEFTTTATTCGNEATRLRLDIDPKSTRP